MHVYGVWEKEPGPGEHSASTQCPGLGLDLATALSTYGLNTVTKLQVGHKSKQLLSRLVSTTNLYWAETK